MKRSFLFTKTSKTAPADEQSNNAKLLIRAGYISKEMAGVYDFLPLGLRTMNNIEEIIRQELNAIGCQEIKMTTLQRSEPWEKTDRWDSERMDIWFKTELATGSILGLAPTHEEPCTEIMRQFIKSYKDLPVYVYQFQTKFRNELRAKSGIMRTREFLMKDLYSFNTTEEELNKFYAEVEKAYKKIYDRLGIGEYTFETFASGGVFSKYSHEFQTILPVGEDTIYFNKDKSIVLNEEVYNDEVLADLGVKREELESANAAEVGNIFKLMLKYSEPLGLTYADEKDENKVVYMGSYGIGVSRVMGVIAELLSDEKGLVWPENIAPYKYYLVGIGDKATEIAQKLHDKHQEEIIWDDRDVSAGEKFADSELMGIPYRIVISDKTLKKDSVELVDRKTNETKILTLEDLSRMLV